MKSRLSSADDKILYLRPDDSKEYDFLLDWYHYGVRIFIGGSETGIICNKYTDVKKEMPLEVLFALREFVLSRKGDIEVSLEDFGELLIPLKFFEEKDEVKS